jgi:SAM-dependent methyltransferase
MNVSERILFYLSRSPKGNDYQCSEIYVDNALNKLTRVFPNFSNLVSGKRVVDFGCGAGYQSIGLVREHKCSVVGIDSNPRTLKRAIENAHNNNVDSHNLYFVERISPDMLKSFDVVISHNSFEHYTCPSKVLDEMASLLISSGIVLLTFGPPWYAPYGSHMHFFCKIPWVNVVFPEKTVMKVRNHFRCDGAKRYEDVESGLNRMTIKKFESIISSCNMKVKWKKYECVKGINWLSGLPLIRELFINNVSAILVKAT